MLVGEPDSAVGELERLLSMPSVVGTASLKLDPLWAPLRGNPRFEKLLKQ
jgi:hypothetical protein